MVEELIEPKISKIVNLQIDGLLEKPTIGPKQIFELLNMLERKFKDAKNDLFVFVFHVPETDEPIYLAACENAVGNSTFEKISATKFEALKLEDRVREISVFQLIGHGIFKNGEMCDMGLKNIHV